MVRRTIIVRIPRLTLAELGGGNPALPCVHICHPTPSSILPARSLHHYRLTVPVYEQSPANQRDMVKGSQHKGGDGGRREFRNCFLKKWLRIYIFRKFLTNMYIILSLFLDFLQKSMEIFKKNSKFQV